MSTLHVADLIHTPYLDRGRCVREGLDCWGLARLVLARLQVYLPRDPADALAQGVAGRDFVAVGPDRVWRRGDLLELEGEGGRPHLGVVIDTFRFIHATRASGVRLDRIDLFVRSRQVRRVLRPRALEVTP